MLVTDGANNSGEIAPETAADLAKAMGVRTYTIGVGREGKVPMPLQYKDPLSGRIVTQMQLVDSELDEDLLEQIASRTGGEFFRATDPEALKRIYDRISEMEKTDIETQVFIRYSEVGPTLALFALGLILMELVLAHTVCLRTWE